MVFRAQRVANHSIPPGTNFAQGQGLWTIRCNDKGSFNPPAPNAGIKQDGFQVDDHIFLKDDVVRRANHAGWVGIFKTDSVTHKDCSRIIGRCKQIFTGIAMREHGL